MKKVLSYFSVAALAAVTVFAVPVTRASAAPVPQEYGQGQEPWAAPPPELQGVQHQGFHDGIEGARKDAENHRPANVNNRDEYRHPNVPRRDWRAYRRGFRRGYRVGVEHLMRRDHDRDHYR
ncbi:MAG TPA: hypothetical protein VFW25_05445 [Silvibacterium sp.]|nr:hypothetical protein [Silvibacterium sp.]